MFMQSIGFSDGQGDELVNIFPYTSNVIWGEEHLLCLGMSVCYPIDSDKVLKHHSKSFEYDGFSFEFSIESSIYCLDNLCKICGSNNYITIYSSKKFESLQIVRAKPFALLKAELAMTSGLSSVIAINILEEKKSGLSIVFKDPARIAYSSRHHISIEYHGDCMYVSREPVVPAVRRLLVETAIHRSNIAIGKLHYTPLIEVVDPYSILIPHNFYNRCIEMTSYNITSNAINSIIKVYGSRVMKIQIDDVEYDYRHNVIRMAMAPLSESQIRLCLQPKIV
ncbi:MAG: hypothetical protein QXT53_01540 [Ignisphaera sp.]